jgi:hypothetical protein
MSRIDVVIFDAAGSDRCPHNALIDIWPRASAALQHFDVANRDEKHVQAIQHDILRIGRLAVPSLWHASSDHWIGCLYYNHRVLYRFFAGAEEYFWITTLIDRCYALGVLYFPARGVAVSLYPHTIDSGFLAEFEIARTQWQRRPKEHRFKSAQPFVVTGFHHMMHTLWNDLPGLESAINAGLAPEMNVIATHQPLGPLAMLFPEFERRVEIVSQERLQARNGSGISFVALGGWTISPSVQRRVLDVADQLNRPGHLRERDLFKRRHTALFWISVKPPYRTILEQAKALALIIEGIRTEIDGAGFILNGVSYPWDYDTNGNYEPWFRDVMRQASAETSSIIGDIMSRLSSSLSESVRAVHDVPVSDEIAWSAAADFYFCHGGSMHNKIGWLRPVAGVVHSNSRFVDSMIHMIPPLESIPPTYFVPSELIADDDPEGYSELQMARRDQNYRFRDVRSIADFVVARYRETRTERR